MSKDLWKGIAIGVSGVVGLGVIAKIVDKVLHDDTSYEDIGCRNPLGFGCMMHHSCTPGGLRGCEGFGCGGLDDDDIDDEEFDGSGNKNAEEDE